MMAAKKTVKKRNTKNVVKANASRANKLTGKEKDFCYAYIANRFNGTRAARDAGYKGADNVLGAIANENLKKPKIRKVVVNKQSQRIFRNFKNKELYIFINIE